MIISRPFQSLLTWLYFASILFFAPCSLPAQEPEKNTTPTSAVQQTPPPVEAKPYVLVGAGDIASCKVLEGAQQTARLIEQIPGEVFAAGDLAYERGTAQEFKDCYDKTWGKFKNRTHPSPGNHEFGSKEGSAYFDYWGAQAGPRGRGYYSFDLGAWHIISLNTNCSALGANGCGASSEEELWLKQDLAAHTNSCIIAYGHHALYSSGVFKSHALHPELRAFWQDLYNAHADLMLVGHEHSYERFAPQDPNGNADPKNGIREIVVGTGGRSHDPLGFPIANSEKRNAESFGVLKLTLWPGRYTWEFIPTDAVNGFRDSGVGVCHNVAPVD
ncbi:MAG TPA: metallophosphoesterase [Candidatus Dormibacteraeota bacterium]|nr:metallophosphoesterase [Candidatus Dormibacteraeota bacterium]